jgi:hypothetical protein
MKRRRRVLILLLGLPLFVFSAGYGCWEYRYPYGHSHCCDKQLMMALHSYADDHDGWFPRGEATPEASLSLLYRHNEETGYPYLLRGKTVPLETTRGILESGGLLGPDTCGWHYVEGLRIDDDGNLALFWDKAGLGHNGERLHGGRYVCRLNSDIDFIRTEDWDAFLAEQDLLRSKLKRK